MKYQITANLTPHDFTVIQALAVAERRKTTDVIRNLLDDISSRKIEIEAPPKPEKEKLHSTAVRVDDRLNTQISDFKEDTGLSVDKALHLALDKIQRTQPELFAAIDALGKKQPTDLKAVDNVEITERQIQQKIHESRRTAPITPEERDAAIASLTHRSHDVYLGSAE